MEFPWIEKFNSTPAKARLSYPQKAFESFKAVGLPRLKDEMWMYTNPISFAKNAEPVFSSSASLPSLDLNDDMLHIPFIDGAVNEEACSKILEEGVVLKVIRGNEPEIAEHFDAFDKNADGFQMLAIAAMQSALYIRIKNDCVIEKPIVLHFIETGDVKSSGMLSPICLLNIGRGSRVEVIEKVYSLEAGKAWTQPITSYIQEENSKLEILKLLSPALPQQLLMYSQLQQKNAASASILSVMTSGKLLRNLLTVNQIGEEAHCKTKGLALIKSGEHFDMRSRLFHLKERGVSEQLYKSVVSEKARFVFNGKIYIEKGAQKVNSSMLNKNLLLGKLAEADTKPELEVYADDVQAGHGASIGQLDLSELFYLMSRGISRGQALELLAKAYVEELILEVESETLKREASRQLAHQLEEFSHQIEGLISKEEEAK